MTTRLLLLLALLVTLVPPALAQSAVADSAGGAVDRGLALADVPPSVVGGVAALLARVAYPEAARQEGIEGRVFVEVVVDREGRPLAPVVLRSPDDRLSEVAVEAVLASEFVPGRQEGEPVRARYTLPIAFQLQSPEPIETEAQEPVPLTRNPILINGLDGLQARVTYPESAWRQGVEGTVVVQFIVNERGFIEDAVAIRSPDARLSDAAIHAVRASLFMPGVHDGEPIAVRFAVPVHFRLP